MDLWPGYREASGTDSLFINCPYEKGSEDESWKAEGP